MKKFTFIFVLLTITASFVALYFVFLTSKNLSLTKNSSDVATEAIIQPQQEGLNLGPSVYEDYSKDIYNSALEEKRVLVLYFTANWCPICMEQEPINQKVFDSLDNAGVVGLKVHILDSETTDDTDALAKKFDVFIQHTFVILDPEGVVFYRYTGPQEEGLLTQKILDAVGVNNKENSDASTSADPEER